MPLHWDAIGRVFDDRSGNISILFAGSLTMLIATSALGVDTGAMFLEKRRLQGIADAAALAAASDPTTAQAAAQRVVTANGDASASIAALTAGTYVADPGIASADRFTPGSNGANAVKIEIRGSVPTFFGRALTGKTSVPIVARATAARINLAAFSLGSGVVAVDGGLANAMLSGLAGTDLKLTAIDYNGLATSRVDLLRVIEALRASLDLGGATFAETLGRTVSLSQAVTALADATGDPAVAALLRRIAPQLPTRSIRLADVIDLGPLGTDVRSDAKRPIEIDALSTLRALLEIGQDGHQVTTDTALSIPGLASTRVTVVIGARASHSPWIAVGRAGDTVLHTAQTRVLLETKLAGSLPLGAGAITLPIYLDLGAASARLTDVSCVGGRAASRATIAVTPSLGRAAIIAVDPARIADFTSPVVPTPAPIVAAPLIGITALADLPIGGATTQLVDFDADDIATHRRRSVSSTGLTGGLASALISRTSLDVRVVGIGLGVPALTSATGAALALAAGPLDTLIDQIGTITGVKLGTAGTWIDGVRCGTPRLVA